MNEIEIPSCAQCSGLGRFMGQLGKLEWFRCEDCGWEFSREAVEEEE